METVSTLSSKPPRGLRERQGKGARCQHRCPEPTGWVHGAGGCTGLVSSCSGTKPGARGRSGTKPGARGLSGAGSTLQGARVWFQEVQQAAPLSFPAREDLRFLHCRAANGLREGGRQGSEIRERSQRPRWPVQAGTEAVGTQPAACGDRGATGGQGCPLSGVSERPAGQSPVGLESGGRALKQGAGQWPPGSEPAWGCSRTLTCCPPAPWSMRHMAAVAAVAWRAVGT